MVNEKITSADKKAILAIIPTKIRHIVWSSRKSVTPTNLVRKSSLLSLKSLIQNAVLIESIPNKKTDVKPDIKAYHRFYVPVSIGDKLYTVRLVAEETVDRDISINPQELNLYDLIVEENKKLSSAEGIHSQANAPLVAAKKASYYHNTRNVARCQ